MIKTDKYGIYHATNEGVCTWAEFAEEIFKIAHLDVKVKHITTAEYPIRTKRPMNSRLSKNSLKTNEFKVLENWRNALNKYINFKEYNQ